MIDPILFRRLTSAADNADDNGHGSVVLSVVDVYAVLEAVERGQEAAVEAEERAYERGRQAALKDWGDLVAFQVRHISRSKDRIDWCTEESK